MRRIAAGKIENRLDGTDYLKWENAGLVISGDQIHVAKNAIVVIALY